MHLVTGYQHHAYADSLSEFGTPRYLPRSGGWILKRPIPHCEYRDAMGSYPLFACADWSQLAADLEEVGEELVSLSLVADPFGPPDAALLRCCFPDRMAAFKEHFVLDLDRFAETSLSAHHRRYARKALRELRVECSQEPAQWLDDWTRLYAVLIARHSIRGIPAFSRCAFARQLQVPGIVAFRAVWNETNVGMLLWYQQQEVGYYHLGAYSEEGYLRHASFALFRFAIDYFRESGLRWLDLGAGAGVQNAGDDGLSRFKQGWATGTRTAYLCGRIFSPRRYAEIVRAMGVPATDYFPAYRLGEFGRNEPESR